ncbi:MAG: retropepsin-like domain-containing protein [Candidatus Azobacteroides sp.]|nr:retropepsin-like domain-containing protein [Candidatus Azobacteroides sp.]
MKKSILFLIPLIPFFVMCQNSNKKAKIVQVLPSDTISMQYNSKYANLNMPILDGIVNDSLHFKVFFDTGTSGSGFAISESFKNLFDSDSTFVQIGKFKKQMDVHYYKSNQRSFLDVFGKNTILVGWEFFENKIIEFDFQNQHILVYNELPSVVEYSKIKIIKSQNSYLLIPAQVVIQGKTIEATVLIDTGCNSFVALSSNRIEKQGIDTKKAYFGKATVSGGLMPGFSIPADTIKIGDLYVANQNMQVSFDNFSHTGLLGTKTLENFSVILDLINFDLYLKKIEIDDK